LVSQLIDGFVALLLELLGLLDEDKEDEDDDDDAPPSSLLLLLSPPSLLSVVGQTLGMRTGTLLGHLRRR
jgi:hypothetical protein